jgi:glycosyltransferase involved in cell wall biosynthesis
VVTLVPEAGLVVVGRGLAGEEAALARAVRQVEVGGWIEPVAMPALFAGMAAGIVPWADTPPNRARNSAKVLELMAAGLPLVGYAVGELPCALGDCGVLVPPGDDLAFAQALVALLVDRSRAERLGAAARRRVESEFTWDRLAGQVLAVYETALAYHGV